MTQSEIEKAAEQLAEKLYPISSIPKSAIANCTGFELLGAARKQIKESFLAGAEHAKPRWVKCSEEMPTRALEGSYVLIVVNQRLGMARCDWCGGKIELNVQLPPSEYARNITHWMPLPPAPEAESNEL